MQYFPLHFLFIGSTYATQDVKQAWASQNNVPMPGPRSTSRRMSVGSNSSSNSSTTASTYTSSVRRSVGRRNEDREREDVIQIFFANRSRARLLTNPPFCWNLLFGSAGQPGRSCQAENAARAEQTGGGPVSEASFGPHYGPSARGGPVGGEEAGYPERDPPAAEREGGAGSAARDARLEPAVQTTSHQRSSGSTAAPTQPAAVQDGAAVGSLTTQARLSGRNDRYQERGAARK